jgi:hypothetical protein
MPLNEALKEASAQLSRRRDRSAALSRGVLRRTARRAVSRLLRPYVDRQQAMDEAQLRSIATLGDNLARLGDDLRRLIHDEADASVRLRLQLHMDGVRDDVLHRLDRVDADLRRLSQRILYFGISTLMRRGDASSGDLTPYELSVFSQNGEDGVLAEIFHRLGRRKGHFVEIGAQGTEANCLFLADALGWSGMFVDASEERAAQLERRYRPRPDVVAVCRKVTAENVEEVLENGGAPTELDLLSLDVDGNDYWIWAAVQRYRPAVVVTEYNASLDAESPLVQEYAPTSTWDGSEYFGANLAAFNELGRRKGYRLVHADLTGVNLFFVRDDLAGDRFNEADPTTRGPNYHFRLMLYPEHTGGRRFVDPTTLRD